MRRPYYPRFPVHLRFGSSEVPHYKRCRASIASTDRLVPEGRSLPVFGKVESEPRNRRIHFEDKEKNRMANGYFRDWTPASFRRPQHLEETGLPARHILQVRSSVGVLSPRIARTQFRERNTTMTGESPIYSIVLNLRPECPGTIRATMGHQAHSAFLRTIKQADPALAEALHAPGQSVRPFTVSRLLDLPKARAGRIEVSPAQTYPLRFTILRPLIFRQFMNRFLHSNGRPTLQLDRLVFQIHEILVTPEASPWSCYTTFEELYAEARPERNITLQFLSPTAFNLGQRSWGKQFAVLPEPVLVFRRLLRVWNAFSPDPLDTTKLEAYVTENVIIKRYVAQTQMLSYPRHRQIGFRGTVTYGLMLEDEEACRQLNALANFAFYAGIGYKTTMGMGQARRIRERDGKTRGLDAT